MTPINPYIPSVLQTPQEALKTAYRIITGMWDKSIACFENGEIIKNPREIKFELLPTLVFYRNISIFRSWEQNGPTADNNHLMIQCVPLKDGLGLFTRQAPSNRPLLKAIKIKVEGVDT